MSGTRNEDLVDNYDGNSVPSHTDELDREISKLITRISKYIIQFPNLFLELNDTPAQRYATEWLKFEASKAYQDVIKAFNTELESHIAPSHIKVEFVEAIKGQQLSDENPSPMA